MKDFYIKNPKGHIWKVFEDTDEVDQFAYAWDIHNGPECIICGYTFCIHCTSEERMEECGGKKGHIERLLDNITYGIRNLEYDINKLEKIVSEISEISEISETEE